MAQGAEVYSFSECWDPRWPPWQPSLIRKIWSLRICFAFGFRVLQRLQYCTMIDFWHQVMQDGHHGCHLVQNLLYVITRKVRVRLPWNFTLVIDSPRGQSLLIFGMLESKMATMVAILDPENMKFQNLLRFWLQGTPGASVLHNNWFLASRDPRWSPRQPSCPKSSLCDNSKSTCPIDLKFTWFIDRLRGQSLFIFGMLGSKMATAVAILDRENMKFQNFLRFWLQGTPEASVLHNDRFLASPNPRWSPQQPSCPKPSLCDGLKSPCMIVLKFYMVHWPTKGPKSVRFRNAGI